MKVCLFARAVLLAAPLMSLSGAAAAQSDWAWGQTSYPSQNSNWQIDYAYEFGFLSALETAYESPGSENKISELRWSGLSNGLINLGLKGVSDSGLLARAKGGFAVGPWAYMKDFDWFGPDFRSYQAEAWTHRSRHEDTSIDWYLSAELAGGYRVDTSDALSLELDLRAKYTTLQWTASGGSYVYSDSWTDEPGDNYRAYTGQLTKGPAVTYKQAFPSLQLGISTDLHGEGLHFGLDAAFGATLGATATDTHWMRGLVFEDQIRPAPMLSLGASLEYEIHDMALVFGINHERIFHRRGDELVWEDGVRIDGGGLVDVAGTSFKKTGIQFGLRKHF